MYVKFVSPMEITKLTCDIDTSNPNMHKTVAEVNADTAYTNVRDSVKNMHDNAESHACVTYFARISNK